MDMQSLIQQIRQWNLNRLDLFALSEPNENGEFFGVMRFYYQDSELKVSTKCIRVSSSATTNDVIDILIEKFRPDLRMLQSQSYALYEVYSTGDDRKLADGEYPLLVQLNWGKNDREGRFLLKQTSDKTSAQWTGLGSDDTMQTAKNGMQRRLSRREKKELKKREKEVAAKTLSNADSSSKENIASQLYKAAPESSFTRSISNPEMVMRRRRLMKLERKLQEIRTSDEGPNSGGTLKIYGDTLCPDVPYKTLLLSVTDTAAYVVRETLNKYGLEDENAQNYCLIQVVHPSDAEEFYGKQREEYVLDDDDCPLDILAETPPTSGPVTFQLRRRPLNERQRSVLAVPGSDSLPYIIEVNPDGTIPDDAREFVIPLNGLEIGCEKSTRHMGSFLKLIGSDICQHQCLLSSSNGAITATPLDPSAAITVNGIRISNATMLPSGAMLQLGRGYLFRFVDPLDEQRQMSSYKQRTNFDSQLPPSSVEMDLLPATIQYREDAIDSFVYAICANVNVDSLEFKLTPTYVAYMAARHVAKSDWTGRRLTTLTSLVARTLFATIEAVGDDPMPLAVWMANSSEMLHFFSHDIDIGPQSVEAQNVLAECVQQSFFLFVDAIQQRLHNVMASFYAPSQDIGAVQDDVLSLLSSVIGLLLRARVNAALTIQLFSQLFHFINAWLFNQLVGKDSKLCTSAVGHMLLQRLHFVEVWAEKQGLELAAECHLARVIQAASLLRASKASINDITDISSSCYKLNSIQLRALLNNYIPDVSELPISSELIERAVAVAQNTADALARKEGASGQITLMEDSRLQLPFLLPEDGYSCDFIKGLNNDVLVFVQRLEQAGLCLININPVSPGLWTAYLSSAQNASGRGAFPVMSQEAVGTDAAAVRGQQPVNVIDVTFPKYNNSIGLSIVAAKDGRLQAGDQLLEIDGISLTGLSQEQAADVIVKSGQVVTLKVAKQAAIHHGLGVILDLPPNLQQGVPGQQNGRPSSQSALPPNQYTEKPVGSTYFEQPVGPNKQFGEQPWRYMEQPPRVDQARQYTAMQPSPPREVFVEKPLTAQDPFSDYPPGQTRQYADRTASPQRQYFEPTATLQRHYIDQSQGPPYQQQQQQPPPLGQQRRYVEQPPAGPQHYVERFPAQMSGYVPQQNNEQNRQPSDPIYAKPHAQRDRPPNAMAGRSKSTSNIYQPPDVADGQFVPEFPGYQQTASLQRMSATDGRETADYPNHRQTSSLHKLPSEEPPMMPPESTPYRQTAASLHRIPAAADEPNYRQPQQVQQPRSHSSQPNLSVRPLTHPSSIEISNDLSFTSKDLLLRAQPGRREMPPPTSSKPQQMQSYPSGPTSSAPVGGRLPAHSTGSSATQSLPRSVTSAANPWDREQREKDKRTRETEMRRQRDEEIQRLESVERLSPADADRLRRLKLQAEFDRRAYEPTPRNDFRQNETDMTPAGRAKVVHYLHQEMDLKRQQIQDELDERDRLLVEAERARNANQEMRMKQVARRADDPKASRSFQQQPADYADQQWMAERNTNNNNSNPAPLPPERSSSYNVYSGGAHKKAVSFHELVTGPDGGGAGSDHQLVDRQLSSQSYGYEPPTPGVIGTHEYYRDPRDKIQANRQQQQQQNSAQAAGNTQTPERMSFRDKMRRFAAEAGEDTPVDKSKSSRAEQRIEFMNGRQ